MPRNIEIQARITGVESLLPQARALADGEPVTIEQDDSLFVAPQGRLKLRQFADSSAELIHYHSAYSPDTKASDNVRVPGPDPAALREALARTCGLLGRVRKQCLLLMAGITCIHLDRVAGLRDFMELEVFLADGQSDAEGAAVAEALMDALGLADAHSLADSCLELMQR